MTVLMGASADGELWARAVAGESAAFGELFERHAKRVYNFCFRQTANWAEAEDAMAEVFLVAWKRRESVELTTDDESVLPWLLGVALNVLRNRARSMRRAAAAVARVDARNIERDFADELVGRLADEKQMNDVLRVVHRLPPQEQDVLAVCAWAGLSYDEAAIALGVPVGTVRSRLSRARAHIRELGAANGHDVGDERVARAADDRG
jgi:RNA polymerase sigma-70 factor (ECF subfamily)